MTRNTRQKVAIREAFEEAGRPLSTGEVLDLAQSKVEKLGIATVYRNVKSLVDEGWLATVELPGETSRYEIAGKDHHHHFQCESCSRVFELHGCLPGLDRLAETGYSVRRHELVLYGSCPECNGNRPAR
ncbi:MAG: transcriptional repressor [Candidatus Solibacter sp.]|nr:transcriptional repressor [Candidatus Solibacter sp.]